MALTTAEGPVAATVAGDGRATRIEAAAPIVVFVVLHLACLLVFRVGVTSKALALAGASYAVRCFGVCAGFHRYFSHRAFRANRVVQFLMALAGTLALQKGVLWWAATHRRHHAVADTAADLHSPHQRSFLYSHCGWFLDPANQTTDRQLVRDLERYPELVWLDRWNVVPVVLFGIILWAMGPTVFVWAFCISTVALWHAVLSTGSFSHRFGGYRNFDTRDDSRNSRLVAIALLGEGWHNNHHRFPRAARHGISLAEPDPIYWGLRALQGVGAVRDLQPNPAVQYGTGHRMTDPTGRRPARTGLQKLGR